MEATASAVPVMSAREAAELVADGDVVAVCGVVWSLVPERLVEGLELRFLETGHPRDLTEHHLHVYGMGDGVGLERFAHEGMVRRVIGGSFAPPYWFKASRMNAMVTADAIEAFILPAGVICALWRETGGGRPGVLSDIGLGTFVDPRQLGGAMTERARRSGHRTSEVVEHDGREYLLYRRQPIDVSFIRGTSADEDGNLALEGEPLHQAVVAQAMATKASGGKVVAQVKRVVQRGTLDPRLVQVPGFLVDAVVLAPEQQMLEYGVHPDSPAFVGDYRLPVPDVSLDVTGAEAVIAHRAAEEIVDGALVNLGAGLPVNALSKVLTASGRARSCTVSIEHGSLGGVSLGEFIAQTHWNPTSMMSSPMTFDVYTGGSLDIAFLGAAQVDGEGSVNVAKVGDSLAGIGGFMDIAQGARTVVFCGTLTYRGAPKFVEQVDLVAFSGPDALRRGQRVLFVTELGVFELRPGGLTLVETQPGVDVARDIAPQVRCAFAVAPELRNREDAAG